MPTSDKTKLTTHPTTTYNPDVEQALLGAILIDQGQLYSVSPMVKPADFVSHLHKAIFKEMLDLADQKQSVDLISVADRLADNVEFEKAGGSAYLAGLTLKVPSASVAQTYAELVKEKSQRRKISKLGTTLVNISTDDEQDSQTMMAVAEKELRELANNASTDDMVRLNEVCDLRFESYSEAFESDDPQRFAGIKTGFYSLDSLLGGLEAGQMMILAARPGMGKTAMAMNIACKVAGDSKKIVGVFSLEMTTQEITDRLVAAELGVESRRLNRGQISENEFADLGQVMDRIGELPIYVDDRSFRLNEISSKARQLKMREGLDLLIVDYLQLLDPPKGTARENRVQQVSEMTRQLKLLARELDSPIIVLSQLNRECEKRTPPIPMLADLRESGSIEQDADSVVMLYRDGKYNVDCEHPNRTDVLVLKNRHGPDGRLELEFDPKRVRFNSIDSSRRLEAE